METQPKHAHIYASVVTTIPTLPFPSSHLGDKVFLGAQLIHIAQGIGVGARPGLLLLLVPGLFHRRALEQLVHDVNVLLHGLRGDLRRSLGPGELLLISVYFG